MRMRTVRRGALVGLVAAACLVAGGLPASAAPGDGSAYGLVATLTLLGAPINMGPFAAANTNGPTQNSLVSVNVPSVASTGAINTSAVRDDSTGAVNSSASTANLSIGVLPGPPVSATLVEATCSATQAGNSGTTTLAGVQLGNLGTVGANPAPNTVINVPGPPGLGGTIASITFNEQIPNPDGSLTVNAVHVRLLQVPGSPAAGDLVISSATCGPAALPVPLASGSGLLIGLGLLAVAVPVGIEVVRRRRLGSAI